MKNRKLKHLFSLVLCVAMVFVMTVPAFAATQTVKIGNMHYEFRKHWGGSSSGLVTCPYGEGYCGYPLDYSNGTNPTAIPEQIEGYPVICLRETFRQLGDHPLTGKPTIPQYVIDMESTFLGQTSTLLPDTIPDMVQNMKGTFDGCVNMQKFPTLGKSVKDLTYAFRNCAKASGNIEIPASVTKLSYAFSGCAKLSNIPDISHLDTATNLSSAFYGCAVAIGGTDLPQNPPADISSMFRGCTNMTTPPSVIPDNVTDTSYMFYQCENLSGEIDIRANLTTDRPVKYKNMFSAAATVSGAQLVLNYTAQNEAVIDDIIANKTMLSNLVKGSLLGDEDSPETNPETDPGEDDGNVNGDDEGETDDSNDNDSGSTDGNFDLSNGKGTQDVIIQGIVEPINTLDVDIPIKLQFIIDENRDITYTQGAKVISRSPAPLVVSCKSVTVPSGAPNLVADNAFANWDNLTISQTRNNIAISINGENLSVPGVALGDLDSGYSAPAQLPIRLSVLYGKQWNNSKQLVFDYAMNMELALAQ